MEEIKERIQSLDSVQLRSELLRYGEKVGPVTPSTHTLFLNRLAEKIYRAEHPHASTQDAASSRPASDKSDAAAAGIPEAEGKRAAAVTTTPTGGKGTKNGADKEEDCTYYVVTLAEPPNTSTDDAPEHRVFTEKKEALAFMKKHAGSRLKVFSNSDDVKQFRAQSSQTSGQLDTATESKAEEVSKTSLAAEAEKSAFKGPRIQELVQFRKLVEKGEIDTVRKTVWDNPRYLVSGADTPVILHEGMRHNLLHIAAKSNQAAIARLVLDTVLDPQFTKLLYSNTRDTEQSRRSRIAYLADLYLNSPDKGSAETPLHIACKMGHPAVVQCLVMYSATDRTRINKYDEKPQDIICSRYRGNQAASVTEEIQELLKGLCVVPLLRSVDNITVPVVGQPCSPDHKVSLPDPSTPSLPHSPKEPRLTLSAYAGPMSPSKARDFQKQWLNPRCLRNSEDAQEITSARRADAEKGYERIGRKLARELHVPWTEYWQFLDAFADFSSHEGLLKLEKHLSKQKTLLTVLAAMETQSSDEEGAGSSSGSADGSEEESGDERYYSCDEESASERGSNRNTSSCPSSAATQGTSGEEDDAADVFEDSLDSFFDTRSYIFGQRLQLKNTNNNDTQLKDKEAKAGGDSRASASTKRKDSDEESCQWRYRDSIPCVEEDAKPTDTSSADDTSHSLDATSPEKPGDQTGSKKPEICEQKEKVSDGKGSSGAMDKSFNTVMVELSDDLETKLIFSPEGKVVPSRRAGQTPDVGICLGQEHLTKDLFTIRRRKCPLEVVIQARKGKSTFRADVLVHSWQTSGDDSSSEFDDSYEVGPTDSRQTVVTDVKVVARNTMVFKYMRKIWRPVQLTVGLLEPDAEDISQHRGCVRARIVRRHQSTSQETPCFIYGSTACKTDLDVVRAMCDTEVDAALFPAVHAWLSLVTATQQQGTNSWPSPAKLRHQHRLSQLHSQSFLGSPHPISPLVGDGTVTSTPLSRTAQSSVRCNRNLSPERATLQSTPRAWLFKSPT